MATKTENVETLYQAGVDTKTNLKKLDPEVLDQMVADLEKKDEQPAIEVGKVEETASEVDQADETPEVTDPEVTEPEVKEEVEVVAESVQQLGIFTEFIYHAKNEGVSIKVENLGNGDAYVNAGKVQVGVKEHRLLKGESRLLEGVTVVNLIAASQPEVKITEIK